MHIKSLGWDDLFFKTAKFFRLPVSKELLTGSLPVSKELLTGRLSVNNFIHKIMLHCIKIPQSGDMTHPFLYLSKSLSGDGKILISGCDKISC